MRPQYELTELVVADMAASLAFYRRLGVDLPAGIEGQPHVEATLASGLRLAWDTEDMIRSLDPHWQRPTGGHRIALAFRCPDGAAVDREYADLVAAGYQGVADPFDAFWGQRYATVRDPDGNPIDLFAPTGPPA